MVNVYYDVVIYQTLAQNYVCFCLLLFSKPRCLLRRQGGGEAASVANLTNRLPLAVGDDSSVTNTSGEARTYMKLGMELCVPNAGIKGKGK